MKTALICLLLAPVVAGDQDRARFEALAAAAKPFPAIGDRLVAVGKQLIGSPYQVAPLEQGEEKLFCNLSAFDCVTLVESCLAVSRSSDQGFDGFTRELERIRYRNGRVDGYASRLHYFSDWIHDNQRRGLVRDLTRSLGGVRDARPLHFMTAHRASYAALADDKAFAALRQTEQALTRKARYFLPKAKVARIEGQLQDGDILAFTTAIRGLDVSHTGLVIRQRHRAHLLHAPLSGGRVTISHLPIAEYLKAQPQMTGMLVARPQ